MSDVMGMKLQKLKGRGQPAEPSIRILVTGTRGKSSLVRLLHAGLTASGLRVWSRITGVLPRSLSPEGTRVIRRAPPANVKEMLWWLGQAPQDTEAVVMENSAVAPELQPAAARWLAPTLVVWTTLRADHEDVWGPGRRNAAQAILRGVPRGAPVVAGREVAPMHQELEALGCPVTFAPRPPDASASFREENVRLGMAALGQISQISEGRALDLDRAKAAMEALCPDIADFQIVGEGDDLLAVAFSANDVESASQLFCETGWRAGETTLLFHHRSDRAMRLKGFLPWIRSIPWRDVVFTRVKRPLLRCSFGSMARLNWQDSIRDPKAFAAWREGRGRVFACGNVAGWPLDYLMDGGAST